MARYYPNLRGILPKPMGTHPYGWLSFTETNHLPVLRAGDAYYWFLQWGELVRKNGADGWSLDYDKIIHFIEGSAASQAGPCFMEFYGLQNDLPDCIAELRAKLDPRQCEIVDLGTLMHLAAQVQPSTLGLTPPAKPNAGDGEQPFHNVETERDAPLLVMQYIEGESLQSRIDRTGPLETLEILRIGMQIAAGLSAAHQQGVVHRDIKPSNVLLEQGIDRALITDFGLARAADDATLTRSGVHPGTPQFMSPEQAKGDPVDARSDLFSLGSVLYTMCAGRPPFRAESSLSVLRRIADDEPRRIRELNPNIPEWLYAIVKKLMAKAPADRYSCAADVAALLEQCLAHEQQPEFIPLPDEAQQLQQDSARSPVTRFLYRKARSPMTKILVSTAAILGIIAYYWQSLSVSQAVASLQGEWIVVASEREGNALPKDQLFNERLVINGHRFSRHQTAPDGTDIDAEKGKLSIDQDDPAGTIDFKLSMGTIHGLYKSIESRRTVSP
ncbi:MAG: protein kinase domain-containing protein [Pirellulaceae bacterium]